MARSMTAYGKGEVQTKSGCFLIELHSVNRKGLDIQTDLSRECFILDLEIRARLKEIVKRGTITVRIRKETGNALSSKMPSIDSVKEMHAHLMRYAKALGYTSERVVRFSDVVECSLLGRSSPSPLDESLNIKLLEGLDKALQAFVEMKEREGAALVADLVFRLTNVRKGIEKVQERAILAPQTVQRRLETKLEHLNFSHQGDPERLLREVVLFADKVDVSEEITRLISHIQQCEGFLLGDQCQIGRELGFLAQEMYREAHTISAKSQDLETIQTILEVKLELEKIKEQIANIE